MLAFTEHTFGLQPLTGRDAAAYDYGNSFDFAQEPLAPTAMTHSTLTPHQRYVFHHPPEDPEGT